MQNRIKTRWRVKRTKQRAQEKKQLVQWKNVSTLFDVGKGHRTTEAQQKQCADLMTDSMEWMKNNDEF